MRLNKENIEQIVAWLGHDGALAGLDASDLTASEMYEITEHMNLNVERKSSRHDMACDIVNHDRTILSETPDELMDLSRSELDKVIRERNVSSKELLSILGFLEIEPRRLTRSKLIDFFVNEVADLGMYQRVSKGSPRK